MATAISQLPTTSAICRAAAISFTINVLVVAVIKRISANSQALAATDIFAEQRNIFTFSKPSNDLSMLPDSY